MGRLDGKVAWPIAGALGIGAAGARRMTTAGTRVDALDEPGRTSDEAKFTTGRALVIDGSCRCR